MQSHNQLSLFTKIEQIDNDIYLKRMSIDHTQLHCKCGAPLHSGLAIKTKSCIYCRNNNG